MRLSIIVVLTIATVLFSGCSNEDSNVSKEKTNKQKQLLTENEKLLFENYTYDNLYGWLNGEENALTITKALNLPALVSSDEYQTAYDKNEVSADQQFREKSVIFYGIVKSIDRSLGENYSISFNGGENPFINPQASMADGYTDFLANLNKGDKIALSCVGNGKMIGFAQVKECIPFKEWANTTAESSLSNLDTIVDLKNTPIGQYLYLIKDIAVHIPQNSTCFVPKADMDACMKDIGIALKKINNP